MSGSLAQLASCQPHCISPNYASGASRLLLGLLAAGQLLFWAKQANFGHLLSTGPLMMMVLRYYSHGVRGTQQGPHLLSFTPPAPSAPLRRFRRRSGAFGAGFFLFFPLFSSFFGLCQHEKSAPSRCDMTNYDVPESRFRTSSSGYNRWAHVHQVNSRDVSGSACL